MAKEMRNAFDVLRQKQETSGSKTLVQRPTSERVDCPVCGKTVAAQLINAHLDLDHPPSPVRINKRVRIENPAGSTEIEAEGESEANSVPDCVVSPTSKNQPSIHSFWGGNDYGVPAYFVLEWPQGAYFSKTRPTASPIVFERMFSWREQGKDVFICSTLAPGNEKDFPPEKFYKNIPLLKSHLQKCIRRSRASLAVQTALTLLRMDQNELLRRLPIIMIEDVMLLSSFTTLVWLMAASAKGFKLPTCVIAWVLGAVHRIASCPYKDDVGTSEKTFPIAIGSVASLSSNERDLLYALQLRKSFGGMQGDMAMLNAATATWHDRFHQPTFWKEHGKVLEETVTPIDPMDIPELELDEWELSAIDFHCSNILDRMAEKGILSQYALTDQRRLMWLYGSSMTNKSSPPFSTKAIPPRDLTNDDAIAWKAAEKSIHAIARSILHQRK